MKMTKIALALGIAAVAFQAQAETVYLAGASATASNYRAALTNLCSGTVEIVTSSADSNKFAVKCSTDFTGLSGVNAVSFSVTGGSFTAVSTSAGVEQETFVDLSDRTKLTAPRKSEGGFLDIDAAAFPSSVLDAAGLSEVPATEPSSFSQVFGVAVSNDLYVALQTAQGLTGCGVDSVAPACQPSITKAQYATIASDAFNSAKLSGVEFLIGSAGSGKKLTLCRRVSTSGTQAASNEFFLKAFVGGDGTAAGSLAPATAVGYDGNLVNSGTDLFQVVEGSTTGNARACLSDFKVLDQDVEHYAIGVLSLENNPDLTTATNGGGADRKWRYVKIGGVHAYDTSVNSTGTAKAGQYEFWFSSQKYGHTANGKAVVDAIDLELSSGVSRAGLFDNASSAAKRSSNTSPVYFE